MDLGTFSVSLNVADILASKAFYGKLGFAEVGGNLEYKYLIMRNGTTTIGLFQGMFEKNILTFNPGWDAQCNTLEKFSDVRELQDQLKAKGLELDRGVEENTSGPGSLEIVDPDGNPILIDQHV